MTDYSFSKNDTIFLRFLAILLIVNSHLDFLYPVKQMATGGAIGNALFFMLSSYGLFKSYKVNQRPLKHYLLNRISKLYPSVWIELIIIFLPFTLLVEHVDLNKAGLTEVLSYVSYFIYPYHHWFLGCLMIYYVLIFPIIKDYKVKKILFFVPFITFFYLLIYLYNNDLTKWTIEATSIRYFAYFLVFLSGIILADKSEQITYRGIKDWFILLFFISCLYFQKYLMSKGLSLSLQFIQQLLLFPIIFYFLKISRSPFIQNTIMGNSVASAIIRYISDRTLQIYIVHGYFITMVLSLKISFPINILIVSILSILSAAIMKYIADRYVSPCFSAINKFV